jgi:hypothetical protein
VGLKIILSIFNDAPRMILKIGSSYLRRVFDKDDLQGTTKIILR